MRSLKAQGFEIANDRVVLPADADKATLRGLHAAAARHRIDRFAPGLRPHEERLLARIASGREVHPEHVLPRLVEVQPDSEEELLFRYASLHWSIPVSSGYGRRLRFLVIDEQNERLIGLFGLGDPVFSLAARDEWVGWDPVARKRRLSHVMDAFVLGAVPPYSFLLCGKLVAMLTTATEVRNAFRNKYAGQRSLVAHREFDGRLAMITTTSAFGRSSLYNRVTYAGRCLFYAVGFTRGSGEFHFSNGLYAAISDYANRHCEPTAKHERWGTGFRSRREIVKKCLIKIGISSEWLYHGVQREVFVVPLARNARQFLRGEHSKLCWFDQNSQELFSYFRERWLIPRSRRDGRYRLWDPRQWELWGGGTC